MGTEKANPRAGQKTKSKTLVAIPGENVILEFADLEKEARKLQLSVRLVTCCSKRKLLTLNNEEPFIRE